MRPIGIGLIGFGTIGTGVVKVVRNNAAVIERRLGFPLRMVRIADLDTETDRGVDLDGIRFDADADGLMSDPEVDIVVELIGGYDVAKRMILAAIGNGKHVVTANKALLALHGKEIFDAAREQGVDVGFEAAVAGGIPILRSLREGLAANFESLHGILNGTTNYVLSEMEETGEAFEVVLKRAQDLGYAEADPTYDVDGIDAAHKLALLTAMAYGAELTYEDIPTEGIRAIQPIDIEMAAEFGYRIKLLGIARIHGSGSQERVEARVHPTLVPAASLLAKVDGAMNAVEVRGDAVGPTLYYGAGAGELPTASAVVGDLMEIAREIHRGGGAVAPLSYAFGELTRKPILDLDELECRCFVRFTVEDHPGVLGQIAGVLGENGIGIESLVQRGSDRAGNAVSVLVFTHAAREKQLRGALREIDALSEVVAASEWIRIEEGLLMADKPSYRAWFESLANPEERYGLDEVVYTDREGGLLQVVHDVDELRKTSAVDWKKTFQDRRHGNQWPYGSGVWGYKEWVLPEIDNENIVSMYEGHSNLFWAERYGRELGLEDLWLKLCGNSHTGSFKDLGMTVLVSMVKEMMSRGKSIPAVACASTGDTSAALAAYAAAAGIPAIVFLPAGKISLAQLIQPVANGAIVFALETDFDGCMKIVKQVAANDGVYLANSMNSLRIEGQKTIALEILQQFDWEVPEWLVIPGGNLGNVSALAKGLDMLLDLGLIDRKPRICLAQAEAANPLYLSYQKDFEVFEPIAARKTLASAIQIGDPVSVDKAIAALRRYDGVVEQASESELAEACASADRTGLFNCPHTGVALAATAKLVERGLIRKSDRVVVISTAHGLKFVDFKLDYHKMQLEGIVPDRPNPPIELEADYGVVRDRMLAEIDRRFGH